MRFRFPHFIIPRGNRLESTNIYVQPPRYRDWRAWAALRGSSREFLTPWEPTWPADSLSRAAYRRRMHQAAAEWHDDAGYAFLLFRRGDNGCWAASISAMCAAAWPRPRASATGSAGRSRARAS